jgi:hypothetical protein
MYIPASLLCQQLRNLIPIILVKMCILHALITSVVVVLVGNNLVCVFHAHHLQHSYWQV